MEPERIIAVVEALDPLSELPRTGWLLRGVRPCESIADHSHGVALLAMLLADAMRERGDEVDVERVMRMALVHDAPEARTGDVPMPSKTEALEAALSHLERELVGDMFPPDLGALWEELERGESVEARVVKAADKIQMLIKASIYERHGRGELDELWQRAETFDDRGLTVAREVLDVLRQRGPRNS